jgi:AcrR family transcriptional regulator
MTAAATPREDAAVGTVGTVAAAEDLGPRAARTREGILAASRELFMTAGYAGTRVNMITAAAGISRAAFYTYFRDKREVFDALGVASYRAASLVIAEFDDLPERPTRGDLEGWTARYFTMMDEYGAFNFSSSMDAPDDEPFRASSTRLQMRTAWSFGTRLQRRQNVATDSPDALGLATLSMLDRSWFVTREAQLPVDEQDMIRTVAHCLAAILDNGENR